MYYPLCLKIKINAAIDNIKLSLNNYFVLELDEQLEIPNTALS